MNYLFVGLCPSSLMWIKCDIKCKIYKYIKYKIHYVSEDGSSSVFRRTRVGPVDWASLNHRTIFIFHILFTIKTMHKVQQTSGSQWYIPSSKTFRIPSRIREAFSCRQCSIFGPQDLLLSSTFCFVTVHICKELHAILVQYLTTKFRNAFAFLIADS